MQGYILFLISSFVLFKKNVKQLKLCDYKKDHMSSDLRMNEIESESHSMFI